MELGFGLDDRPAFQANLRLNLDWQRGPDGRHHRSPGTVRPRHEWREIVRHITDRKQKRHDYRSAFRCRLGEILISQFSCLFWNCKAAVGLSDHCPVGCLKNVREVEVTLE